MKTTYLNKMTLKHLAAAICATMLLSGCNPEDGSFDTAEALKSDEDIRSAGEFHLQEEFDYSDINKPASNSSDITVGNGVTATCTTEGWGANEVRELTNVTGLDLNGTTIYPGALIQGAEFEEGSYVPVTIPRSSGTIYMTGLTLDKGAQYYADNIEMSGSRVNQAIKQLITDYEVQGTAANASYESEQAYSYEHLLFKLGIDARYGKKSMSADLKIDSEKTRNYSFVKFTQVFYDIVYEDPALATSVFAEGEYFSDPEDQIAPGNPPLYVSKVSYGRMVFFVAESTHDANEVEASLRAAVEGKLASGKVESGLTHQQVLARSKVYYYVIGGAADMALAPINSATPDEMFSKVQAFIADRTSANFSASNPGAPIAYTLNYLKDRTPAKMSYSVNYDKKDCSFTYPAATPAPTPVYSFKLEFLNLTKAEVWVRRNDVQITNEYTSAFTKNLDGYLSSTSWTDIEIVLKNTNWACGDVSMQWRLKRNGSTVDTYNLDAYKCKNYMHWYFSINKKTGEVSIVNNDV